jgi:hypothetical protein
MTEAQCKKVCREKASSENFGKTKNTQERIEKG